MVMTRSGKIYGRQNQLPARKKKNRNKNTNNTDKCIAKLKNALNNCDIQLLRGEIQTYVYLKDGKCIKEEKATEVDNNDIENGVTINVISNQTTSSKDDMYRLPSVILEFDRKPKLKKSSIPSKDISVIQVRQCTFQNILPQMRLVPMAIPIPDVSVECFPIKSEYFLENQMVLNFSLPRPVLRIILNSRINDKMISMTMSWNFAPGDQIDEIVGYEVYTYDVIHSKAENYESNNWKFWCKFEDNQSRSIYFEEILKKSRYFSIRPIDKHNFPGYFSVPILLDID